MTVARTKTCTHLIGWCLLAFFCCTACSGNISQKDMPISNVNVIMQDNDLHYVTTNDIKTALQKSKIIAEGVMHTSTFHKIEQELNNIAHVKAVSCYCTTQNTLVVAIQQCDPFVKITKNGSAYYVDKDGKTIPISDRNKNVKTLNVILNNKNNIDQQEIIKTAAVIKNKSWGQMIRDIELSQYTILRCADGTTIICNDLNTVMDEMEKFHHFFTSNSYLQMPKYKIYDLRYDKQVIGRVRL